MTEQDKTRRSRTEILMDQETETLLVDARRFAVEAVDAFRHGDRPATWSAVIQLLAVNADLIRRLRVHVEPGE